MVVSLAILIIKSPELVISTMINESKSVVTLCINLIAIYAVWLGILEILDKSGLSEMLAKLLSPIIKKLFKINKPEQIKYISLNLSANFLGLGNAATPSGIKAIESLNKDLPNTKFAMLMLLVINTSSIQLLPTTVIGLRLNAGSIASADIILPTILATFISAFICVLFMIIVSKIKKGKLWAT